MARKVLRLFGVLLLLWVFVPYSRAEKKNESIADSSCNQPECLRCDLESAQCVKCLYVISEDTRRCLRTCPEGKTPIWATGHTFMGRVCKDRSPLSLVSHRQVTIISLASVAGAVCVGVSMGILLMLRRRSSKSPPGTPPPKIPKMIGDKRPQTEEIPLSSKEREELSSRLRLLRRDTPYILRLVTETRGRFRGIFGPDAPSETKTKAARAIVRDLNRVLSLIGRKEQHLKTAPRDWKKLVTWSERILKRYKRQQEAKISECGENGTKNSLFMTKKQQTELDRHRWNRKKMNEREWPVEDHEYISGLDLGNNENLRKVSEAYKASKCDKKPEGSSFLAKKSIENILLVASSQSKKKGLELLQIKSDFWNKFSTFRNSTSSASSSSRDDPEQPTEPEEEKSDYITSQTFFDHIEAFAFEPIQSSSNESSPVNNRMRILNKTPTMNKVNLNRGQMSKEKSGVKPLKKEHRIKRISSSIFCKERKKIIVGDKPVKAGGKKRRPLRRQKQVEKEKRIVVKKDRYHPSEDEDQQKYSTDDLLNETCSIQLKIDALKANGTTKTRRFSRSPFSTLSKLGIKDSLLLKNISKSNTLPSKMDNSNISKKNLKPLAKLSKEFKQHNYDMDLINIQSQLDYSNDLEFGLEKKNLGNLDLGKMNSSRNYQVSEKSSQSRPTRKEIYNNNLNISISKSNFSDIDSPPQCVIISTPVNKIIQGGDVYLKVTKKPAEVGDTLVNVDVDDSRGFHQYRRPFSRCEILTDV